MRRILKKIIAGEEDLGDVATYPGKAVFYNLRNLGK
jgi:hypothetical protein